MHKTCEIMNSTCNMLIHKLLLFVRSFFCDFFFILVVLLKLCFFLVYTRHMRSATLIFKSSSQLIISLTQFSALMLSSFIDVSLYSVDAAHMYRRDFDDQMWILLWPRLMLLTYASHRAWSFFNSTSSLECARHMSILKFNPTSRIFSDPRASCTPRLVLTVFEKTCSSQHHCSIH